MKAKTLTATTCQGMREQIEQVVAQGFAPTLAIVFAPVSFDMTELSRLFEGLNTYGSVLN